MTLEFVFWDVQHGSAAYIKTPNGRHMVVDLGTGSYGASNSTFSPLRHLKNNYGVSQLDCVIITHPHTDHLDDIFSFDELSPCVLRRPKHLSEDEVRDGNRTVDRPIIDKYLEINRRYNEPVSAGSSPFTASNNGGVGIKTFYPRNCSRSNLNNHSLVTVFSYANSKMLIPGDNELPSWNELLEREDFVSSIKGTDVLVASHHGRESGCCNELFEHINPWLTIISDGRFCDTSATSRYASHTRGLRVYRRSGGGEVRKCVTTRSDGDIYVKFGKNSDGSRFIDVRID